MPSGGWRSAGCPLRSARGAAPALSVDHQVVAAHRVLQIAREALELPLDPIVLERRDSPARVADSVMVMLASRDHPFEAGTAFPELDSLHEAHLPQKVQSAVDAGDAGVPSLPAQALVDLVRG